MDPVNEPKSINQAILELKQEKDGELNINCTVPKIQRTKKAVNLNNPRERLRRRSQILLTQEQQQLAQLQLSNEIIKKKANDLENNKSNKNLHGEFINSDDESENKSPVKETQKEEKLKTLNDKIKLQKEIKNEEKEEEKNQEIKKEKKTKKKKEKEKEKEK